MRTHMTLITATLLAAALLFGGLAHPGLAQEKPKAETPPPADTLSVLPRPDFHFPGTVGRTYLDSDPPQFPQPVQAPKGAPSVVLILIDDAGFGQFSTFGGGVPSRRWTGSRPRGCATTASTRPPSAARPAPRSSPAAITSPPRSAASPRRPRATTATPACCRAAAGPSARCCGRTDT